MPQEKLSAAIKDKDPELSSIFDALPKTRTELYAFITLIVLVLSFYINTMRSTEKTKIEVNQVINYIYSESAKTRPIPKPITANPHRANLNDTFRVLQPQKVGRNDPCLCGSGKKFKKCCIDK